LRAKPETNYQRYFGTPEKAAESVSRLVDWYDEVFKGNLNYRSPFTDNFRFDGSCAFGLIRQSALEDWLESEAE
jgi:hypothetical protein